jgi:hypothetical protein
MATTPPSGDGRSPESLRAGVFVNADLSPLQIQQMCRQLKERRRLKSSLLKTTPGSLKPYESHH